MKNTLLVCIMLSLAIVESSLAVNYNQGDWVEYGNFRYVTSIAADQKVVYFGTTGGIIRYDRIEQKWLDPLTIDNGLASNHINQLAYDPSFDELWAATSNGVVKYNLTFQRWYSESDFPNDLPINDWKASRFTNLFTPFKYFYQNGIISDPDMRNHKITVGWRDQINDNMYVGTWGIGPAVIDTRQMTFALMQYGPFNGNISRLAKIGNSIWMGTDYSRTERGLTRYDIQTNQWTYYEPGTQFDMSDADMAAAIKVDNNIWIGTRAGLLRLSDREEFKSYTAFNGIPSENVTCLASYGGYIYVGTDRGLGVIPSDGVINDSAYKSPLPTHYLFENHDINAILVYKNRLYVATEYEVCSYDADSMKIQVLDTPSGDLAAGATAIYGEGNNLYFAIRYGVVIIDMNTNVSKLATAPAYSERWQINQVLADSHYIWSATTTGLWRYKKDDGSSYLYTTADGLPTNSVNSLVMDGDYLWLGTSRNLIRFRWNSPGRGD
jgi:ligand-binding sensor domain-containing protein